MSLKSKFKVVGPQDYFRNSLHADRTGRQYGVKQSIDMISGEALSDTLSNIIEDDELTAAERQEAYIDTISPILTASADLMNAVAHGSPKENRNMVGYKPTGFCTVRLNVAGKAEEVDLQKLEQTLVDAVNEWLETASQDKKLDFNQLALPLPINREARQTPGVGIERITDVLHLGENGYEPRAMLSNKDAEKIPSARPALESV